MPALARPGSEGAGRLGAQRRCAGHLRTTNPAHRHHAPQRDRGHGPGSTLTSREQINAELRYPTAEGVRQSQILTAEGAKQSAILTAEGERQSHVLVAQGQAEAIGTVLEAIHRGRPDPQFLACQYLQTLPKLVSGDGNRTWLIPSELTRTLDAFASGFLDRRTEQTSTSGPAASGEAAGAPQMPPMVIPARPTADGAAGPRSIHGEQAPGTQHLERDDARRTG